MARAKKLVEVEEITCDYCGDVVDDVPNFWLTVHYGKDVVFESKIAGDYCKDCLDDLSNMFLEKLQEIIGERYDKDERCLELERKLLEEANVDVR